MSRVTFSRPQTEEMYQNLDGLYQFRKGTQVYENPMSDASTLFQELHTVYLERRPFM
jgi:hypothetical protein